MPNNNVLSESPGQPREEQAAKRSLSSQDAVRQELAQMVDRYLAEGGNIEQVAPRVMTDPPRKPGKHKYGRGPL